MGEPARPGADLGWRKPSVWSSQEERWEQGPCMSIRLQLPWADPGRRLCVVALGTTAPPQAVHGLARLRKEFTDLTDSVKEQKQVFSCLKAGDGKF